LLAGVCVVTVRVLANVVDVSAAAAILSALVSGYTVFLLSAAYALNQEERSLAQIAWQRTRSLLRLAPSTA
jgi:hypothetical protein